MTVSLTASDFHGLYAILPTPALAGAERLDAGATVNLAETARVIDQLIWDGVSGLIVLGTTGECATLSEDDYDSFVRCVGDSVGRRVRLIVGTTALGGHSIARRIRLAAEVKADGILLGLPMWQPLTAPAAITLYAEASACFPSMSIMVYANERAFRFKFDENFWAQVCRSAPTVTAAKFSRPNDLRALISATEGRIHFMPNEMTVGRFFAEAPTTTTACWATAAAMGPQPALAMMSAVLAKDTAATGIAVNHLKWAVASVKPLIEDPEVFARFNIQIEKARINAAGYCDAGPVRSPYNSMPSEYTDAAQLCGRRWARLRDHLCKGLAMADFVPDGGQLA